ncbi:transmembrane protein 232 [Osmerus eperlanus]|uniref:transmembrane protein 232 n=1 Tax=Osmerus eperlanus TaxID=29151 RepID=UPI002E129E21
MPISSVPVVRRLAIISQTHKADLQKRLLSEREKIRTTKHFTTVRNPFEITEQFITKYNLSYGSDEQEKYVEQAKQLLIRSQRRAGLKCMGEEEYVELPLAWTELLLLGVCLGKIQNDSLDSLLMSLDHAPVQAQHIPSLFYLAESVLYWVCSDTAQKPSIYTCEVKMLKLGYLVFLRLFLFHISGNLTQYQRSKSHLHSFLKALSQCQPSYEPYPNILFYVDFMLHTGEIICAIGQTENDAGLARPGSQEYTVNQVLWHCLLSWYCVQNNVSQLSQVTRHLVQLTDKLHSDNWVDCALGLMVLGEAAKSSKYCLQILMRLYFKSQPDVAQQSASPEGRSPSPQGNWPWQLKHIYTTVLADICLHSTNAEVQKTALTGDPSPRPGCCGTDGLLAVLISAGIDDWRLRYSAVQALACIWRGLSRAPLQEGLRNSAWVALQGQLTRETDPRVRDAPRVLEAEMNLPENVFLSEGGRAQAAPPAGVGSGVYGHMISWRLACALSHACLTPSALQLQPCPRPQSKPAPFTSTRHRQEASSQPATPKPTAPPGVTHQTYTSTSRESRQDSRQSKKQIDFNMRTSDDLMKVVEDQWQKELHMKMAEEEELEKEEEEKKREEEKERFKEMMRRRMEKVKKETRPYELPGVYQSEM